MRRNTSLKIAVFSNSFWSIYNFRKPLIEELMANGYKVTAIGVEDEYVERVKSFGCDVIVIKSFVPHSTGYLQEARLLLEIFWKLNRSGCKYIFTFTIKPNLFTALSSYITRQKVLITVNGLGSMFTGLESHPAILFLFKHAFSRASKIIFQNRNNFQFFHDKLNLTEEKVRFVAGSGVNLEQFPFSKRNNKSSESIVFLMACRLVVEKGLFEYIQAAKIIKEKYPQIECKLVVAPAFNPSAIDISELEKYKEEGVINLLSKTDQMNLLLEEVDVLVLPSYYNEGIPKILIEGLSKGLPIITTDWVGCRETVDDNVNGFLIKPKDTKSLAAAMEKMIQLPLSQRNSMRNASRIKAETTFNEKTVIAAYMEVLQDAIN